MVEEEQEVASEGDIAVEAIDQSLLGLVGWSLKEVKIESIPQP